MCCGLSTKPLCSPFMVVVELLYFNLYCLLKQARVYIWMVNKLMIGVNQSQEPPSNNGFLCSFITTCCRTWKQYRGNWREKRANCDTSGDSRHSLHPNADRTLWSEQIQWTRVSHDTSSKWERKSPFDAEVTNQMQSFTISNPLETWEQWVGRQSRTHVRWCYIAFATEYDFSISIISTALAGCHCDCVFSVCCDGCTNVSSHLWWFSGPKANKSFRVYLTLFPSQQMLLTVWGKSKI